MLKRREKEDTKKTGRSRKRRKEFGDTELIGTMKGVVRSVEILGVMSIGNVYMIQNFVTMAY
jgi:hypothetical protein